MFGMTNGLICSKGSMLDKSKYLLKYHDFYYQRIQTLKDQVKKLKASLPQDEFVQHEHVKFAARVRHADQTLIPENPNKKEYRLRDNLRKFRRYKQGLRRYRLFFCFSSTPPIILYLYLNDEKHLRKEGDKNDPYEHFKRLVKKGSFSHNPSDENVQRWIQKSKRP